MTVAALRAVGIPARQVYTPRWAHTDDNHAWVEAWVDGDWHFMGACEPEPVLDMGWFNASVSRAMILHTKVAGDYKGSEDVISRNPVYTSQFFDIICNEESYSLLNSKFNIFVGLVVALEESLLHIKTGFYRSINLTG